MARAAKRQIQIGYAYFGAFYIRFIQQAANNFLRYSISVALSHTAVDYQYFHNTFPSR